MGYDVFTRTWWKANSNWPDGREPGIGRRTYLARNVTEEDACAIRKQYNDTHKPGKFSRKAECEQA